MSGELAALGSAFLWASSTVLMRALTRKMPIFLLSAGRTFFGTLVYWLLFAVFVGVAAVLAAPLWAIGYLVLAVLFGLLLGDLLYLKGQELIGVSRALPISGSYPLLTTALAILVLGEELTTRTIVGVVVTIGGVMLVARPPRGRLLDASSQRANAIGLAAALAASFFWALSTITVKPAVQVVDPVAANAIRLPLASVLLLVVARSRSPGQTVWGFGRRTFLLVILAGLLHAFSSGLYLVAVGLAGAAKAATLTSTAPIFAAPMAMLFEKERPGRTVLLGTLLSVVGIYLVVSQ